MKKIKVLLLMLFVIFLSGCASKFEGTWCKYSDIPSSLVILSSDISDDELRNVIDYISSIPDLKTYDVIDKIEEASIMITVYYTKDDNINNYDSSLRKYSKVKEVKSSRMNTVVDKLVIGKKDYVYDKSLNDLSASETKGSYTKENNKIILEDGSVFYYKDKFLCYDSSCNEILTKAKGSDCQ